jgi:hypothetical protein
VIVDMNGIATLIVVVAVHLNENATLIVFPGA